LILRLCKEVRFRSFLMALMLGRIARTGAHRVIIGVIVTATVGFFLRIHPFWSASLAAYDAFAFANLSLIWMAVALTADEKTPLVAQRQDVGRTIIFVVVIIAGVPLFSPSHF
jgi:hypothetical protein